MLFWEGRAFLDPLFPCNIWLLGCSLSQRIWVHRYDTLNIRCMWRVHAYFLEYLWHKSQKCHNSIVLNHMNTCTLARFQCIYAWFAFSIAKASKASKLLCRAFGPKCDYDGDIVIWYILFMHACVWFKLFLHWASSRRYDSVAPRSSLEDVFATCILFCVRCFLFFCFFLGSF